MKTDLTFLSARFTFAPAPSLLLPQGKGLGFGRYAVENRNE